MFDRAAYEKRIQWFQHDRFGMFIHWGLYSIPARGEWIRSVERISVEDYQQYFDDLTRGTTTPRHGPGRRSRRACATRC